MEVEGNVGNMSVYVVIHYRPDNGADDKAATSIECWAVPNAK